MKSWVVIDLKLKTELYGHNSFTISPSEILIFGGNFDKDAKWSKQSSIFNVETNTIVRSNEMPNSFGWPFPSAPVIIGKKMYAQNNKNKQFTFDLDTK